MSSRTAADDALAGDHNAIKQLLQGDEGVLGALTQRILDGAPPSPAFARASWEIEPDFKALIKKLRKALRTAGTVGGLRAADKSLAGWMRESVLGAFPRLHEACIDVRVLVLTFIPPDDGGFAEAQLLEEELRRERPQDPRLATISLLVAKGAFVVRDYSAARDAASRALERFEERGDAGGSNTARRNLAGALLSLRDWTAAFAVLDDALVRPGPLFGGEGTTISCHSADPKQAVIDEACQVALWARDSDCEWIRALGGLAEVFANEPIGEELRRRLGSALAKVTELDDFDTIVRQLRERSFHRSATVAARAGVEAHPEDSLIHSVFANLSRGQGECALAYQHYRKAAELLEGNGSPDAASAWMSAGDTAATQGMSAESDAAFDRARSLVKTDDQRRDLDFYLARSLCKRDPAAALDKAFALFHTLERDPRQLAESELGFAVTELLLDLLLAQEDPRALGVQKALVEAKKSLWGECPSVWLERHNLGTVFAQLGNHGEAQALFEDALRCLLETQGEGHPNVELCRRSIAQLEAERHR